jgi:uncharacterized protein YlxP (DUF503 family)
MIVGAALVELHVHGSRSLKDKRGVVRSISQRVRNRCHVAVAEVGGQDTWTRALLGFATVGSDALLVRRALERAVEFVESLHLAEVVASDVEVLRMPLAAGLAEAGELDEDDGEDDADELSDDDDADEDDGDDPDPR